MQRHSIHSQAAPMGAVSTERKVSHHGAHFHVQIVFYGKHSSSQQGGFVYEEKERLRIRQGIVGARDGMLKWNTCMCTTIQRDS